MELNEALQIRMKFNDLDGEIRVDENGYICLNDLGKYFPNKRIDNWKRLESTVEFIETIDKFLNTSEVSELKSIISKRGKYNGGTYGHELIAMEFATWLSPEFKLKVFLEYMSGKQSKLDWNMKRILACANYKIMSSSVDGAHEPAKFYHFANEAKMLNNIVFGEHRKDIRETATEEQLDMLAWLEGKNSAYIDIEMPYAERKEVLYKLAKEKYKCTYLLS